MGNGFRRTLVARFLIWCLLSGSVLGALPAGAMTRAAAAPPNPAPLPRVQTADGREAIANRVIVGFKPGVTDAEKDAVHQAVSAQNPTAVPNPMPIQRIVSAQVVSVTGSSSLDAAVQAYRADPRVQYAEPDYVVTLAETPNDPSFSQQYGMVKIQAPAAWSITHGSASVNIAVLDCGIYEAHPDLAGKVVARWDFTNSASQTNDLCNHGTHVAGIASANTNNSIGVAGVGYSTSLFNYKVLDDTGSGTISWIASAIQAAANNGANVISMSLGLTVGSCAADTPALAEAVSYAWSRNVVVVAAAGNDGVNEHFSPADCDHVVAVASTDQNDARSSFSNYGSWVTIAAPGSSILSTVNPNIPSNFGNSYGVKSGTSMATPHVAGLVGLLWATSWGTSAQAIVDRLMSTGDVFTDTARGWTYRRINADVAVSGPTFISNLSPPSTYAGSPGFTLTIGGDFFAAGAQVLWNGVPRAATFISSQQVTTNISAADLRTVTTVTVAVRNANGDTSLPVSFAIHIPPAPVGRPGQTGSGAATPNPAPQSHPTGPGSTGGGPTPMPMPMPRLR